MQAVTKLAPIAGAMEFGEVETPQPDSGEALLRVSATGICGTDVAVWRWHESVVGQYGARFPLIPGHEMAGTVVESTSGTIDLGTLVAVNPQIACRHCEFCVAGRATLCINRRFLGGGLNGGWAEYVVVPEANLYPLPLGSNAAVAPLLEPLAVASHAVLERVPTQPGDVIVVIGAGPIGLLALILALHAGAGAVFVTGVEADKDRLELARQLGGIPINIDEQDPAVVISAVQRDGADVVYETSGSHLALSQALTIVRRSGSVCLVGLSHAASEVVTTPVVLREVSLVGSRGYNETTWSKLMRILPHVEQSALRLISHTLRLDQFEAALETLTTTRAANKIVLVP